MPTHYQVLGVHSQSGYPTIRAAYLKIMKTCHPDVGRQTAPVGRYRPTTQDVYRINRAYSVLRNPRTRAEYDAELARRRMQGVPVLGQHRRLPVATPRVLRPALAQTPGFWIALCLVLAMLGGDGIRPDRAVVESADAAPAPSMPVPAVSIPDDVAITPDIGDVALLARDMARERAIDVSADCYESIQFYPSPSAADQCIAFDLAFRHWQGGAAWARDSYFGSAAASRRHVSVLNRIYSRDRAAVTTRIDIIQAKVFSAVVDAVSGDPIAPAPVD